jgi:hypothetical protein
MLAAAHAKLLADKSLQFDFAATPPVQPPPEWLVSILKAIGAGFVFIAPALKYVFWIGLLAGAVLIAWFMLRDMIRIRGDGAAKPINLTKPETWRPQRAAAQALLSDADALAAEGRFAEAAHLLLTRSIDDFAGRRPGQVRPALTARDLARAAAMPAEARNAFSQIAEVVERSLFGGRPVDAEGFGACRRAYHDFAIAEHWR